jgi:uncharacterized protein
LVVTWLNRRHKEVPHPSVQVGQYQQYLSDTHSAFYEGENPIRLAACSYLHNYVIQPDDPLVARKFVDVLSRYPTFGSDAVNDLTGYLQGRLAGGGGADVLRRIERSRYRPSRKLMNYVSETIVNTGPWVLLDEQVVVFEKIRSLVASAATRPERHVVVVRGGPGTGKSVLAINLLGRFLADGRTAHYATGSKAFTRTLWKLVGSRARPVLKYFNNYRTAAPGEIDVLICDEAHRIRETSNDRFTPKAKQTTEPQIRELLRAARVAVFFIDDKQGVRPNEIGSSEYIKSYANAAEDLNCRVAEFDLEVQFRCAGSAGFINWVSNTLAIERTANVLWTGAEAFDFQIFETPKALEAAIRAKTRGGSMARLAAGFCWEWSDPNPDGTLVDDVVIGDWRRPWNAKPDAGRLAKGIPPAELWATETGGIDQVGCVYTAQGFEVDYIGVIWGKDLAYDFDSQAWSGNKHESRDRTVKQSKADFLQLVKNTYRVLLSRGMKGCYVCFLDKDTERFVKSRIDLLPVRMVAEPPPDYDGDGDSREPD